METKSKIRFGLSMFIVAALSGWSSLASAAQFSGYVCYVRWNPAGATYGDHGYLQVQLKTLPACGGQNVTAAYHLSVGATTGTSTYYLSERKMAAFLNGYQQAAVTGTRVIINTNSFGGGEQVYDTHFYAN